MDTGSSSNAAWLKAWGGVLSVTAIVGMLVGLLGMSVHNSRTAARKSQVY